MDLPFTVPSAGLGRVFSPLTPGYEFRKDDHYDAHHMSDHAPNLHAPDLHKPHAHKGHSHNMCSVFLHIMAVSTCYCLNILGADFATRIHLALSASLSRRC